MFRTAFRLNLFDRVGANEVVSVGTLAEATSSDEVLIGESLNSVADPIIALG